MAALVNSINFCDMTLKEHILFSEDFAEVQVSPALSCKKRESSLAYLFIKVAYACHVTR